MQNSGKRDNGLHLEQSAVPDKAKNISETEVRMCEQECVCVCVCDAYMWEEPFIKYRECGSCERDLVWLPM